MRVRTFILGALAIAGTAGPAIAQDAAAAQAVVGGITPKVVCASNPAQDYALFLPSNYDRAKRWPIVYAFDPIARGSVPLELAKAAAEKYGYIMAGSNQSQNFNPKARSEAVACLYADTHARLNLDDARIYVTGFSGGSRLAGEVAENCNTQGCVAGVIAHGAGFPGSKAPPGKVHFVYFATVGDLDFNHAEMIELRNALDATNVTNRLRVFPGTHQWGPAETWMEALAWLQLQAMKRSTVAKDETFIAEQYAEALRRAGAAEAAGDSLAAWREYEQGVRDLAGLRDVGAMQEKAAALKDSKAVKDGLKREKDEVARQRFLTGSMGELYAQLGSDDSRRTLIASEFTGKMEDLRKRIAQEQDPWLKRIEQRALAEVTGILIEGATIDRLSQRWSLAALKSEIASASVEKPTRGLVQAAKDHARAGDERAALRDLKRAAENGFSNRAELESAEEFRALRGAQGFVKILAMMPATK